MLNAFLRQQKVFGNAFFISLLWRTWMLSGRHFCKLSFASSSSVRADDSFQRFSPLSLDAWRFETKWTKLSTWWRDIRRMESKLDRFLYSFSLLSLFDFTSISFDTKNSISCRESNSGRWLQLKLRRKLCFPFDSTIKIAHIFYYFFNAGHFHSYWHA